MANTKKEKNDIEGQTENEDIKINIDEQLQLAQLKNIELENKLNSLMEMIGKLTTQKEEKILTEKQIKRKVSESYKQIDPYQRVLLINMIDAGGTYITHNGKSIRFDKAGQIQPSRFEDVESLRNKYRSTFENLELRIICEDDDALDNILNALYLKKYYDECKITFEELEDLISLDAQSMITKIKTLPKSLQESALSLIVSGVARRESKFMDKNKWSVINSAYNIDIEDMSRTYFSN
jgi:hypothetical protein